MTRPIKFRAWDIYEKKMTDAALAVSVNTFMNGNGPYIIKRHNGHWRGEPTHQYILMQFTNLLDKNGKEIYSDDYLEDVAGSILCVFWGSGKYILQNISSGDIIDCNEANTQNKKIIGNIYENPREHKAMASDL